MAGDELERTEIEAVLETRRELGQEYDAALVDGFADRIERAVEERLGAEVERRSRADAAVDGGGQRQLVLGILSLIASVPICIVLGINEKLPALFVTLLAIVAVNYAHAWLTRPGGAR